MEFTGSDFHLLRRARDAIGEEITSRSDAVISMLVSGKSEALCSARAGQVQGLRDALAIMERLARDMNEHSRSQ